MKKPAIKKLRSIKLQPAVKTAASKPMKTGLKKSDPEYYRKIGIISAAKRKVSTTITPEQLSEWGRKGYLRRSKKQALKK